MDAIVGRLSTTAAQALAELTAEQLGAWRQQVAILKSALRSHSSRDWHLLMEYAIPRRGKRIDAVLLAERLILVFEFKCGALKYQHEGIIQVEDYCLDLRDFHSESRRRVLVPILVATHAEERFPTLGEVVDSVAPTWLANEYSLERVVDRVVIAYHSPTLDPIDPSRWDAAEYAPTPTIVEAARVLYEGQNVREITRCHAGAENLTKTSEAVMRAIVQARQQEQKLICFVTGVPGSGKTLAGLNIVHNRDLHERSLGVFLSGNGPLVRVLSEALARDHSTRTGQSIAESRRQVSTFIHNVHRFIDAHFNESTPPPPDRVIVFDEAQRAWNREQSLRKFKRDRSEPEIMLDIMDRHPGWAVIVALVGSGQEINTGEAGLGEWGRALANRFRHWNVRVSPHAVNDDPAGHADRLFDEQPNEIHVYEDGALHLEVSLRSYKAQAISDFVAYLLTQEIERARSVLASCPDFPIVMTRYLQKARQWLRSHQRGSRRIGLISSSGGRRLRAHGLDVRPELDVENWFLNSSSDMRSSYYLEAPATEFGIQGLELDWTGVCWDIDLMPEAHNWHTRAFKGTRWQTIHHAARHQYVLNKYRVLLTRAREGMIIWVPRGDPSDWTRPEELYDSIAAYLRSCGVPEI
ncbi:MAG TPA: DNA/RNA helicase domain-containing protein [Terriglobia bacterium]|nr:DNA/RNA helicase domain-containing protein [Terriglobia bacterium]